jgi:hypothetical protein
MGNAFEVRAFIKKELSQLFDIRPEWADDIMDPFCMWNQDAPPPIRLLEEVGITGATWVRSLSSIRHAPPVYFRVTHPP